MWFHIYFYLHKHIKKLTFPKSNLWSSQIRRLIICLCFNFHSLYFKKKTCIFFKFTRRSYNKKTRQKKIKSSYLNVCKFVPEFESHLPVYLLKYRKLFLFAKCKLKKSNFNIECKILKRKLRRISNKIKHIFFFFKRAAFDEKLFSIINMQW